LDAASEIPSFAPTTFVPTTFSLTFSVDFQSLDVSVSEIPSFAPTTFAPTTTEAPSGLPSGTPTGVPTSPPTLALDALWGAKLTEVLTNITAVGSGALQAVYAQAVVRGVPLDPESENQWLVFVKNTLPVLAASYAPLSVRVYAVPSLGTEDYEASSVACSSVDDDSEAAVQALVAAGSSSSLGLDIVCGTYTWSIGQCSSAVPTAPSLCVDCAADVCNQNCTFDETFGVYPTGSECASQAGTYDINFIRVVAVTFRPPEPAPAVLAVEASPAQTSVDLLVELDGEGSVYCLVYLRGRTPSSTTHVVLANFGNETENNSTVVTANGLVPGTDYEAKCTTFSEDNVAMTEEEFAAQPSALFETDCCKLVEIQRNFRSVMTDSQVPGALQVSLSALPAVASETLTLSFALSGAVESALFFPSSFTFTNSSASPSLSVAFVGSAQALSANITVTMSGSASDDYRVTFTRGAAVSVTSEFVPPEAPALQSAVFSADGSYITATFDSATNKNLAPTAAFACGSVFSFSRSVDSQCFWLTTSTVKIFPASTGSGLLQVGNSLNLTVNATTGLSTLRAACTVQAAVSDCSSWAAAVATSVSVQAPTIPVNPTVAVSAPATVGSCLGLQLTLGASTGHGGRAWASRAFTVTSANPNATVAASIQSFLNTHYQFSPPTSVPHQLLQSGFSYTVKAQVCNFLGRCGTASTSVTVLANVLPSVAIVGGALRTMQSFDKLMIRTSAFTPACSGAKSTTNLAYTFSVASGGVALPALQSSSTNPTVFRLSAFSLTPGSVYTVSLLVLNTLSLESSTTTVTVSVLSGDVVAKIAGGVTRSVVLSASPATITLDASGSQDEDYDGDDAPLQFLWSCSQSAPVFSHECPLVMPQSLTTAHIGVRANTSMSNDVVAVIAVVVSDGADRSSPAQVTVTVVSESAPAVSISSSFPAVFSVKNQLKVVAAVSLAAAGTATWTVEGADLDLSTVALTASSFSFTNVNSLTTFPVSLVLPPDALPTRSTISFTLTGTLTADSAHTSSTAVVVTTGGPPVPGVFTITPTAGGSALTTEYTLAADMWTAETGAAPLTYEFGFVSASDAFITLQARSEAAHFVSPLPAGSMHEEFLLAVRVVVFDALDASTVAQTSTTVSPTTVSDSELTALAEETLGRAGNADALAQVVGIFNEYLNAVNCSQALTDSCALLNREQCSTESQTCGPCLSGYGGVFGSSNNPCVPETNGRRLVDSTPLQCAANCSLQGSCYYRNLDTGAVVDTCTISSATCEAVCECNSGFHGRTCSYNATSLGSVQDTRLLLLQALLNKTQTENADDQSVGSWIAQLNGNTQVPDELSAQGVETAFQVLQAVMGALPTTTVSIPTVEEVLASIESLAVFLTGVTNPLAAVPLSDASYLARHNVLDQYGSYVSSTMVAGQQEQQSIFSQFRVLSAVRAIAAGVPDAVTMNMLPAPLSATETSDVVRAPSAAVPITNDYAYATSGQLVEINEAVTRAALYNATTVFNSDPFRLNMRGYPCSYNGSQCSITVVLQNYHSVTMTERDDVAIAAGNNMSTYCTPGDTTEYTLVCSPTHNETVSCPGQEGHLFVRCPQFREISVCAAVADSATGAGAGPGDCSTQSFSSSNTTCLCSVAGAASSATEAFQRDYVSALDVVPEGYIYDFEPASSAPTSQPTSPTSLPSSRPTSAPFISSYLFSLTSFMKEECFDTCSVVGDLSDTDVAERSSFCSLYSEGGGAQAGGACSAAKVGNFECIPQCVPAYTCGTTFCASFALMSQECETLYPNTTRIAEVQSECLEAYVAYTEDQGLGSTQVTFGLQFVLPGVNAAALIADTTATHAITNSIGTVLPGVLSITDFASVDDVPDRRKRARQLATGDARITMVISGIPSSTDELDSAGAAADAFLEDFSTAIDTGAFGRVLETNVRSLGTSTIDQGAIDGVSSSSVASTGAVVLSQTAVPTLSPTPGPTFAPTSAPADEPNYAVIFGLTGGLVLVLVLAGCWFAHVERGSKQAQAHAPTPSAPSKVQMTSAPSKVQMTSAPSKVQMTPNEAEGAGDGGGEEEKKGQEEAGFADLYPEVPDDGMVVGGADGLTLGADEPDPDPDPELYTLYPVASQSSGGRGYEPEPEGEPDVPLEDIYPGSAGQSQDPRVTLSEIELDVLQQLVSPSTLPLKTQGDSSKLKSPPALPAVERPFQLDQYGRVMRKSSFVRIPATAEPQVRSPQRTPLHRAASASNLASVMSSPGAKASPGAGPGNPTSPDSAGGLDQYGRLRRRASNFIRMVSTSAIGADGSDMGEQHGAVSPTINSPGLSQGRPGAQRGASEIALDQYGRVRRTQRQRSVQRISADDSNGAPTVASVLDRSRDRSSSVGDSATDQS